MDFLLQSSAKSYDIFQDDGSALADAQKEL